MSVLDAIGGFFTGGMVPGNMRRLSETEISAARDVFESTIPYGHVGISNDLGLHDAPYTTPAGPFYRLHLGQQRFDNPGSDLPTLIHELVHVWQGHHHFVTWGYVVDSVLHQGIAGLRGGSAYRYELGRPWGMYNVEQQAQIVEDWYVNGRQQSDPRFPYIRDRIRHPAWSWVREPF
jgi:hypothetical protein